MQRIITTPLASRFCAPRQRSAQSPPHARSPLRSAADRHTRAAASCSAFLALCRRTACGVPHFGNVSIYWQKNAGTHPRLFPNFLETFPFFDYSILPLFDFVNPFFSFFSILFTQPYSPPPFTRYPCCGTTIIPSFFCTATAVFRAGGGRRSCFRKSGARGGSPLA